MWKWGRCSTLDKCATSALWGTAWKWTLSCRAQPLVGLEAVVRELPPAGLVACLDYLLFPLLLALNSLVAARQAGGETRMHV